MAIPLRTPAAVLIAITPLPAAASVPAAPLAAMARHHQPQPSPAVVTDTWSSLRRTYTWLRRR